MKLTTQRWSLVMGLYACLACMSMNGGADTQGFTTTTVQGTVYLANGQPGSGMLQLSWPAFTTANNQAVAAGRTNVSIGGDGYVTVNLAPNQGSSPTGLYYTAIYHLSDGTTSTEYWVVPSAAQASLSAVRAQVMPAAQAVQAVSKGYVDQSIAELTQSLLTASGGSLSGPLFLNGDPTGPTQAATKHYVDNEFAMAVPLTGGVMSGPLTSVKLGAAYQVDQFPGADFGARLQACVNQLDAVYGGTCDARNFSGPQAMASPVTIATANATVQLPCATIATANPIQIEAGTRNVTLHGCALRGASDTSGSQGGTVFLYSGNAPMIEVGDPTYAANTLGFHIDNVVINTTASNNAGAQGLAAYRTQEMDLEGMYFLGNSNQTGMTLDGTGNYTGGTFQDIEFGGFATAVNAIGHQVTNPATTDWLNASTFVRLHIDCPTSGGNPMAGTNGINLLQGDGNTFTGGDVEGCATALHLGPNAQNNTIVGLRNENSTNQVVADAGSSYNNWMTGGTMFTGKLTDNGTRNSFLDTFHRSFNSLNGDWYGSQQDSTVTNHFRIGTGAGNERGLLNRYQTDYGYRWTTGLSDAAAGEQFYQVLDELNNVYRLSIGQYNHGQSSTNNQTVINAAGSGAVVLNGSANSGTGGVVFGGGGDTGATVATINNAGNAQFNGSLQVGGPSTFINSTTVKNQADTEVDSFLWAGATANQKESFIYKDYTGASQWYMVKDASNNWALNSATGGLDSFKAYQSNNSGDTYINASNGSGHIRLNHETGSGAETDIYSGSSSALVAAFLGSTAIKFPGLAAVSGRNCLQIDNSGYISNTGTACGSGGGSLNGTVNSGNSGQVAYYAGDGTVLAGTSSVAVAAGGTGATTAEEALQNLGAQPLLAGMVSDGASGVTIGGNISAGGAVQAPAVAGSRYASQYGDKSTNGIASCASGGNNQTCVADPSYPPTEKPGPVSFSASPFHYQDLRLGQQTDYFHNPQYGNPDMFRFGFEASNGQQGKSNYCLYDTPPLTWTGSNMLMACEGIGLQMNWPGWSIGNPSGFGAGAGAGWSTTGNVGIGSQVRGEGISESFGITQWKYGVGDNIPEYIYDYSEGGTVAASDESTEGLAIDVYEDTGEYTATCSTGCASGSTAIKASVANGQQGVGRYLIDSTQGSLLSGCHATNIAAGLGGSAVTTDCTVPVSSAWGTLAAAVNTPVNPQPPFTTSETFNVTLTSGSFTTGTLVCFQGNFHEQAFPTAVGTPSGGVQSITVPLRRGHIAGTYVFQGGECGTGLEFTSWTFNGLQYLFDVVGSTDAQTLQAVVHNYGGSQGNYTLPSQLNIAYQTITFSNTMSSSGTTVSFSSTGGTLPYPYNYAGNSIVISGASDSALNATCTNMQWSSTTAGTCTIAGLSGTHSTTSAPTATLAMNGINLWPIAEVIDVQNETLSPPQVDGTMALEPNIIAFSSGDTVMETHHYAGHYTPTAFRLFPQNPFSAMGGTGTSFQGYGVQGGGGSASTNAMLGAANLNPDGYYIGSGGNLVPPNAMNFLGAYNYGINFSEGPRSGQPLLNVQSDTQQSNPNYNFAVFNVYGASNHTSYLNLYPNSGNMTMNTWGTYTIAATNGITFSNDTTSNGNNTLGATGKTNTLHGTTTIDNATITAVTLPNSGVAAGSYTNANITVGADGRVTSASSGAAAGSLSLPVRDASIHTIQGTTSTSEQILQSYLIPANTLKANSTLDLTISWTSTTTGSATCTFGIWANTSNAIGGAHIFASPAISNGSPRNLSLRGTMQMRGATNSQYTDLVYNWQTGQTGNAAGASSIDMTQNQYLVITATDSLNTDSAGCSLQSIVARLYP